MMVAVAIVHLAARKIVLASRRAPRFTRINDVAKTTAWRESTMVAASGLGERKGRKTAANDTVHASSPIRSAYRIRAVRFSARGPLRRRRCRTPGKCSIHSLQIIILGHHPPEVFNPNPAKPPTRPPDPAPPPIPPALHDFPTPLRATPARPTQPGCT